MTEQGASEKKLLRLFDDIDQDSIVILDEIDLLAGSLKGKKGDLDVRMASALMSILDRLNQARPFVYVIGNKTVHFKFYSSYSHCFVGLTSRLHAIDPCFLRAGRLDDVVEMNVKTAQARREILDIMTQRTCVCVINQTFPIQLILQRKKKEFHLHRTLIGMRSQRTSLE